MLTIQGGNEMKKSMMIFAAALLVLSMGGVAQAASPWTEGKTTKEKMLGKLDFGFKNVLGGWTAIFTETAKGDPNCKCKVTATAKGLGRGIAYAVVDTIGGVLHIVTFPITQLDVPLPNNGVTLS